MKATGIVRHIDDLGRVVIPKELRRTLGINKGDPIEILADNGCIIFRPCLTQCGHCGKIKDEYIEHRGVQVCTACLNELRRM